MVSAAQRRHQPGERGPLIAEAAATGAQLVALPEYFCLMGMHDTDKVAVRETLGRGPIQDFLAGQARQHGVWLVGGTLPLEAPEADRVLNTHAGVRSERRARRALRQGPPVSLHAWRRELRRSADDRARRARCRPSCFAPAGGPTLKVGLSVCYDLRFPELYRAMGQTDLILVPAAFTATTGKAHWETLLRARAIENLCYVLAPAQGGRHENGRATFGHSMLIDPWGEVIANRPDGPGVVFGDIDPQVLARCRTSLPALTIG